MDEDEFWKVVYGMVVSLVRPQNVNSPAGTVPEVIASIWRFQQQTDAVISNECGHKINALSGDKFYTDGLVLTKTGAWITM